ncbi:ARM repeat-containing protein [Vararia minispora EC-137]|uniref:ARM repeat-containing protein n=1 Tax=Vararia minispora EC-137 TaxID=1314806 RepID=A0ACB8QUS6_9AGAM|nr:ARM repeat-containing protein [Vararia minispora EC-137]
MEAAQRLIQTWVATPRDEEVEIAASGISQGNIKLVHIVQGLGEYLTSDDDDLRNKGVEFLAKVIGKVPTEHLNRQAVVVLLSFFMSKLEDLDTIIPALKGLLALSRLSSLSDEGVIIILNGIFKHVKMQSLVQAQRFIVFSIIDNLLAIRRQVLKVMGNDFITGYVALAEGEKDPRNLMLAFAIDRVILIEFDIKEKIEDLFNITACYFPISFRPPPDDPYGITADDLKKALRSCLNANAAFGPPAIALFLEKLATVAPPTKWDALATLDECLPVYGASSVRNAARQLWNALKLEIFQPTDPLTEEAALKSVQVVIKTIYSSSSENPSQDLEGLAKDACHECITILKEPEKSQAQPAMKILCAFISTTPSVSHHTVSHVIPHLIKLFLNPDEVPNRGASLNLLASFIAALRDSAIKFPDVNASSLVPYKDEVLGVFTTGLQTPSSAGPAISGLHALVTMAGLLDEDEIGFVVSNVNGVLSNDREDSVGVDALDLLTTISIISPVHVSSTTLPLLFSLLPDRAPSRGDAASREKSWSVLNSLSRLCIQPVLFETLVIRLSTKLNLLCDPLSPPTDDDVEPSAAYAHAILSTLATVLEKKVSRGDSDVAKYIDRLVSGLVVLFLGGAVSPKDPSTLPIADSRLVIVAARIVNLIAAVLPAQKQESFIQKLYSAYVLGDLKALSTSARHIWPDGSSFAPFERGATTVQANTLCLFSEALLALHKEVRVPADPSVFLEMLVQFSVDGAKALLHRESAWHIIASVVNKRVTELDGFLKSMLESFYQTAIADASVDVDLRRYAIGAWAWTCKGLLVQNHAQTAVFIERLIDLFDDEAVNWDAARAVGSVAAQCNALTKSNHSTLKILHAQRYSNSVLSRFIEGAKTYAGSKQNAHLVALTFLIRSVPKTAYAHKMPTAGPSAYILLPLLLCGLELPDTEIRTSVIETLLSAAEADTATDAKHSKEGSLVTEHATSLTLTMLKNISIATVSDAKVRIAALRYLTILPKIVRYDALHPQKAIVLRDLSKALDDPKRAVRKEAVDARYSRYI